MIHGEPMMPVSSPHVSVVIPHYNDLDGLRICASLLERQTLPRDQFEIVVADNNSDCGLDAVREAAPGARVVAAPIQGAGPARNQGVSAAQGAVLAFLDSDCAPEARWLEEGLAGLSGFDFIGGQVITTAQNPASPNPVEAFEIVFNFNFRRYVEVVGFTGTGNMFVRRDVFDRVGGFRAGVSEDMDWCFRARALGLRLGYADRAIVGHPARRNWAELERRWARILVESYASFSERPYGRLVYAVKALGMPLSVVPHTVRIFRSPRLPNWSVKIGAVWVLLRVRIWRGTRMLWLVVRGNRGTLDG